MKKLMLFVSVGLISSFAYAVELTITIEDSSASQIMQNACVNFKAGNVDDQQCQQVIVDKLIEFLKSSSFAGNKIVSQKNQDDAIRLELDQKITKK